MKTQRHWPAFLPLMIVSIAVILFSTAGIAAMMGWRSASTGSSGNNVALHDPIEGSANTTTLTTHNAQKRAKARANGRCAECGLIVSIGEINTNDDDFGTGAAGGVAGEDREPLDLTTYYEIVVRMADGSSRVIKSTSLASWRLGGRVIVIAGTIPPQR